MQLQQQPQGAPYSSPSYSDMSFSSLPADLMGFVSSSTPVVPLHHHAGLRASDRFPAGHTLFVGAKGGGPRPRASPPPVR